MLKPEAIVKFTNFLREQAAIVGANADGLEVKQFGPMTGVIEFDPEKIPRELAETLQCVLKQHPSVDADGVQWYDEYLECLDIEPEDWTVTCLVFDVSDRDLLVFTPEEIAEHREQNVIPIKDMWRKGPTNVYLPLKFKFFDDIVSGYKTIESRAYTENWVKRLLAPQIKTITFQRGYAPDAAKIVVEVKGIELEDEDEKTRYAPDAIPDMATPALILIHLGKIIGR